MNILNKFRLVLRLKKYYLTLSIFLSAVFLNIATSNGETGMFKDHDYYDKHSKDNHSDVHDKDKDQDDLGKDKDHEGHSKDEQRKTNQNDHNDHGDENHDEHAGLVHLSVDDIRDFNIQISESKSGVIVDELKLLGEIQMNENSIAHVSPRFDGVVKAIHKRLGDNVRVGDLLAGMESIQTLVAFELNAPIDGTIVQVHIAPGENLEMGKIAYTIVDTSTVWADLKVYQRDLPQFQMGQKVIITAGENYPSIEGKINYIGSTINETGRTGLARVLLKNSSGIFRPGTFVTGNVILSKKNYPVVVPLSALHTIENKKVIFVKEEAGDGFKAAEVTVGKKDSYNVEIRNGLKSGVPYVTQGGFFLKADLQKENFGDGHAH